MNDLLLCKICPFFELAAIMKYELNPFNRGASNEDLLADLRAVALRVGGPLSKTIYRANGGRFHPSIFNRRFGSWNAALEQAGVAIAWRVYTDDDWFENIALVWNHLGRQPHYNEMADPPSTKSPGGYARRFGSWRRSLEAFVKTMDVSSPVNESTGPTVANQRSLRRTSRTANWRLRFLVLRRCGYRCKSCGRSPANEPGIELQVDHIIPSSKGGETVLENLQALCTRCNGGKSNLAFDSG